MSYFQMYWYSFKWITASCLAFLTVLVIMLVAYYVVRAIWKLLYYALANEEEAQIRRGKTTIIANFMRRFQKK